MPEIKTKEDFKKIQICNPILQGREIEYVNQALYDNDIGSRGSFIHRFETNFSDYIGVSDSICCVNGTAALHLGLLSLGLKNGDEVICPSFTMISPLLAVKYTGAKPVLVDCDETWCIDPEQIEKKITKKTKAILAVHIYGHPCDMDRINEIARNNNVKVIEDAAEAHGTLYKGFKAGSQSDVSCFSFYANKVITTGEGGMVCTNNVQIAERVRSLKNLSFGSRNRYTHEEIGYNYRMTNIQAAIGLAQLERIDHYVHIRRKVADYYNRHLFLPHQPERDWAVSCNWYYGILIPNKLQLEEKLMKAGIETRHFFTGMHKQPCLHLRGKYPMTDRLTKEGLLLPTGDLTEGDLDHICQTIRS
jgi:perosamine synthetase